MNRMCSIIEDELSKIEEKGLTTGNLDTAYKLIDMYKDLKTVEGMEDYNRDNSYSYDNGNSYGGRRRDSMGRYSRDDGYSRAKRDYRYSRANKQDVMDSFNDRLTSVVREFEEMSHDADFPEERQMIDKYVNMLKSNMR